MMKISVLFSCLAHGGQRTILDTTVNWRQIEQESAKGVCVWEAVYTKILSLLRNYCLNA